MRTSSGSATLALRLRPLRIALLLEGIAPWVPVEKIFMTQLGFTPALFATMAAAYYDTLIEEVGHADDFQKHYGRLQTISSSALTASALAGGVIAAVASPRLTYLITAPTAILGLVVLSRFREPTLHRAQEPSPLRNHLTATWRTVTRQPHMVPIAVTMMLGAAVTQMIFEFGPLWLIAATVPTVVFGPYTAGMTSTLGLGGLLAGRLRLDRPPVAIAVAATMTTCGLVLDVRASPWPLIAAQVLLVGLLVVIGIHLSGLLHQLTPSTMRSGVSAGIGTLSWLTFLPCSLLFGAMSGHGGVRAAGWIITASVAVAGIMLVRVSRHHVVNADPQRRSTETLVPVS